jgi:plastocyanin
MRRQILFVFLIGSTIIVGPEVPLAYEGRPVTNGATISGVVKLKGASPTAKKLDVTKDKEVCAKTPKSDPSLIVSGGNVRYAVVSLVDIKKGKQLEVGKLVLDQKGCEYHPHVLAFPAGSTVEVLNPDGILHNIHSYGNRNTPFNMAQPKFRKTLTVKIDKPEIINVKCDVHGWMTGWLFAAENPYFSVTDDHGSFNLTDVPPGTYTLEVWHETLGKQSKKVTVKPKEDVKVTFELAKM